MINKFLAWKQILVWLSIDEPFYSASLEVSSFPDFVDDEDAGPVLEIEQGRHPTVEIEDFIANRDRKPKKEFYSASNKAKESVEFHFDIVTETLAKVYLEQGHYEKAKAAYHQLSLKYPQKSSLFASQIELIDQLITKNK